MALVTGAEQEKKKGPSLIVQAAALLVVTGLAAGIGWYAGDYLHRQAPAAESADEGSEASGTAEIETPNSSNIIALDPITTNLADPSDVWVRMELALLFDGSPSSGLANEIHQDLFAYIRSIKLRQIESPSGYQHLKADLRERARIRSEGSVSDVLVTTLIYE